MSKRALALAAACGVLTSTPAWAKITFDIDYSLDTSGFFNPGTSNGAAARAAVSAAVDVFSDRLLDDLTAIVPSGSNTWTPGFLNPATGSTGTAPITSVAADTLKFFVAAHDLGSGTLGRAGPGSFSASGTTAFLNNVRSRGEAGALTTPRTDFASWGGSMAITTAATDWNFSVATGPAFSQYDLYSVVLHEIGHFLGVGSTNQSYGTYVNGLTFTGAKAVALNGGTAVPLANTAHLDDSLASPLYVGGPTQQPSLSPSIANGQRKLFTLMDWAILDDLGWDLARPGDVNASGTVDFDDLLTLAQNYGASAGKTWSEGDFTYDNAVNFNDLLTLAQNYNATGPLAIDDSSLAAAGISTDFATDWALAQTLVPEPTSLLLLGLVPTLLRRRP